jgi:putative ATPase
VRDGKSGPIPAHLRDAHYPGAAALGHGKGYVYSHDEPRAVNRADYLPDALRGARYYRATARGAEAELGPRYDVLRSIIDGSDEPTN